MISTKCTNYIYQHLYGAYMLQEIKLRNLDKPKLKDTDKDIHWICDSFGLSDGRDLERMSSRTIIALLRSTQKEGASAEDIADVLGVSPARVNYHLRQLIEAGLLYRMRRQIFVRAGSLKSAIEEMRKDSNRIFDELAEVADDIDRSLGFQNRQ
jgi:DNA-binding transcriptional ArsR family regulator